MDPDDCELSDSSAPPQPQQQQASDQSPPSSIQATPVSCKGHGTRRNGAPPAKKSQKTSNVPKKNNRGKRRGLNSPQQQTASPSHSSSSSSPSSTPKNQKKKNGSKDSPSPRHGSSSPSHNTSNLKVFDPASGLKFTWDDFKRLSKIELNSTAPPKVRPSTAGVTCCIRCGLWFKSKHGSTTCNANRPKDLGDYSFEVPQWVRETLAPSIAPGAASAMAHPPDEEFIDPVDWETEFFNDLDPHKMFSSPGTLQSLPRETRTPFSSLIKDLVSLALSSKTGALEGLLLLPRLILPNNLRGRTVVSKIFQNIGMFRKGQFKELWDKPNLTLRYGSFDPARRAEALARAGELGAAVRALTSEGVLDPKEHIDKLKELHPFEEPPSTPNSMDSHPHTPFTSADFRWTIKNSKRKKAADALGWRMDVIKELNSEAINAICKLCKRIAVDTSFISDNLKPFFFGARLIPIGKKGGGIRPIAIGTIFHKLISSAIMLNIKEHLPGIFSPVQFGVGIPGGAENIIHGIRNLLGDHPDWALVSLDLTNAFNSVSRNFFINQVYQKFPNILPWVWQCYGQHSHLLIRGADPIPSACGVRQGDPMGPFLFCLAIQPFLEEASNQVHSLTYMDDIYFVGSPNKMPDVISTLEPHLSSIGLKINTNKSWTTLALPNYQLPIQSKPVVMKTPLATDVSIGPLNPKVLNTVKAVEKVADTQVAILLLRQINNSSLTYTLRTACPNTTEDCVDQFTSAIVNSLATLLRCSKEDIRQALPRITLPLGPGLGFTPLSEVAKPAFYASFLQATRRLNLLDQDRFPIPQQDIRSPVHYRRVISLALKKMDMLESDPNLKLQHTLVELVTCKRVKDTLEHLDPVNKRIVDSTSYKHASSWLTAIPTTQELSMSPEKMVIALRLFLSIPLQKGVEECPICKKRIEDFNSHMLICSTKKALMQRHDAVKQCVKALCCAADLHVDVEPSPFGKNESCSKKDQRRPDLIIHNLGRKGSSVATDISIANPFSKIGGSNPKPLAAALSREADKINKYAADCSKVNIGFHPIILDAYGGITPNTIHNMLNPLIHRVKDFTSPNWAAPNPKAYWYQRLSIALWTFNAYKVKPQSGIY